MFTVGHRRAAIPLSIAAASLDDKPTGLVQRLLVSRIFAFAFRQHSANGSLGVAAFPGPNAYRHMVALWTMEKPYASLVNMVSSVSPPAKHLIILRRSPSVGPVRDPCIPVQA